MRGEFEDVRAFSPARQHADAGRGGVIPLCICVGLLAGPSVHLSICLSCVCAVLLFLRLTVCPRTASHSVRLFLTSDSFRARRATDSDCWRSAAFMSVLLCPCLCVWWHEQPGTCMAYHDNGPLTAYEKWLACFIYYN